jgi:hypothetical protein
MRADPREAGASPDAPGEWKAASRPLSRSLSDWPVFDEFGDEARDKGPALEFLWQAPFGGGGWGPMRRRGAGVHSPQSTVHGPQSAAFWIGGVIAEGGGAGGVSGGGAGGSAGKNAALRGGGVGLGAVSGCALVPVPAQHAGDGAWLGLRTRSAAESPPWRVHLYERRLARISGLTSLK